MSVTVSEKAAHDALRKARQGLDRRTDELYTDLRGALDALTAAHDAFCEIYAMRAAAREEEKKVTQRVAMTADEPSRKLLEGMDAFIDKNDLAFELFVHGVVIAAANSAFDDDPAAAYAAGLGAAMEVAMGLLGLYPPIAVLMTMLAVVSSALKLGGELRSKRRAQTITAIERETLRLRAAATVIWQAAGQVAGYVGIPQTQPGIERQPA